MKNLPWKRYWCPPEGSYSYDGYGFLSVPPEDLLQISSSSLASLESLSDRGCLVLLGEPGMGKSVSLREEFDRVKETEYFSSKDSALLLDLRSYGNEDRLLRDLFESKEVLEWKAGEGNLWLFLDSLDEGLMRMDALAAMLGDELPKLSSERVKLRLACRTAEWRSNLEGRLKDHWATAGFSVYELLPLTQEDVRLAATQAEGVDPGLFLDEVVARSAVPFASRPITLRFLLATFARDGALPADRSALYEEGCRMLCEESNPDRRWTKIHGDLSAEQRLEVASRIAAVLVFANHDAIWIGPESENVPPEDIVLQRLSGGTEEVRGGEFRIDTNTLRETLDTGLFSSRGLNRIGWAHQTYAEFLAARYVGSRMTSAQVGTLITHPFDVEQRLIPQLHETAARLAEMDEEVFGLVLEHDSEVLLRSDLSAVSEARRSALLRKLLDDYESQRTVDLDWGLRTNYSGLSHPGIGDDLRPYICDPSRGVVSRRVAIEIAHACEVQDVQSELLAVALEVSAPIILRTYATHALAVIGDADTCTQLLPLARGEAGHDPDDQMKGAALTAVWPDHLSAPQVFELLGVPKNEALYGQYRAFLDRHLLEHLAPEDLPEAFKWVVAHQRTGRMDVYLDRLGDEIVYRGWTDLWEEGVLQALAALALVRLEVHDDLVGGDHKSTFQSELKSDNEKRRALAEAMAMKLKSLDDAFHLVYGRCPVVQAGDFSWLIDRFGASTDDSERSVYARLIDNLFDVSDIKQVNLLLAAMEKDPRLRGNLAHWVDPVDLNSPKAAELRVLHKKHLDLQEALSESDTASPPLLVPSPSERIRGHLDLASTGDLDAWWCLVWDLGLEPTDARHEPREHDPNLKNLPGWKAADAATKAAIVDAGRDYVVRRMGSVDSWMGKEIFHRPDVGAYKALRLLLEEDPQFVESLAPTVWAQWAPIILAMRVWSEPEEGRFAARLACLAYSQAPASTLDGLDRLLTNATEGRHGIDAVHRLRGCWDSTLSHAVLDHMRRSKSNAYFGELLGILLEHDDGEALTYALARATRTIPTGTVARERAAIAAARMLGRCTSVEWPRLWRAITREQSFAEDVMYRVAEGSRGSVNFLDNIGESQLAELFGWMEERWPHVTDPERSSQVYEVTSYHQVTRLRDSVLVALRDRGTLQACEELERLQCLLPELEELVWIADRARRNARRETWQPPDAESILALSGSPLRHLVQNADQLIQAIVESLVSTPVENVPFVAVENVTLRRQVTSL